MTIKASEYIAYVAKQSPEAAATLVDKTSEKHGVFVSKACVWMVGGAASDAMVLSQIIYWSNTTEEGNSRLGYWYKDHLWIVKTHDEYASEIGFVGGRIIKDILSRLESKELIIKQYALSPFHKNENGTMKRVTLIRLNWKQFHRKQKEWVSKFLTQETDNVRPEETLYVPSEQTDNVSRLYSETTSDTLSDITSLKEKDKNAVAPRHVPNNGLPLEPSYTPLTEGKGTEKKDYSSEHPLFRRLAYSDPKNNNYKVFNIDSSYAEKLQKSAKGAVKGADQDFPSPCELYETRELFRKYIDFVVSEAWKHATKGKPSKANLINHITNYNRANGWLWYESKYRHFETTDEQVTPVDLAEPL